MKFQEAIYCKKCGIIIKDSSIKVQKRAFCKYCFKQENKELWQFKKDIVNEKRRPLRRKEQIKKICICCNKEFETAKQKQLTCGSAECQKAMKNAKNRIMMRENRKYYTKNCKVCGK